MGSLICVRAYLDHAATTPPRPASLDAMADVWRHALGNPAGVHAAARDARRRLDDARDDLADVLGAKSGEIVFTSGGTESDYLAIVGTIRKHGGTALCSAIEHDAVLGAVADVGGSTITVTANGRLDLDALRNAVDENVSIVSVMLSNNETGVVQPLGEIAAIVRELAPNAVVHTDAVQAASFMDLSHAASEADLISISGHKFGAPVGIGALVVRDGTTIAATQLGGGQERERRGGTQNVAGAVALATAARAVATDRKTYIDRVATMRDRLADGLLDLVDGVIEPAVGSGRNRSHVAPSIVQLCFSGVEGEALLFLLDQAGIDASAGSACASGALDPSHVLAAMGVPRDIARGALRLSLGHTSTNADVDRALEVIPAAVAQLRRTR